MLLFNRQYVVYNKHLKNDILKIHCIELSVQWICHLCFKYISNDVISHQMLFIFILKNINMTYFSTIKRIIVCKRITLYCIVLHKINNVMDRTYNHLKFLPTVYSLQMISTLSISRRRNTYWYVYSHCANILARH